MLKKLSLLLIVVIGSFSTSMAQSGSIKVTVNDAVAKETVPFAVIVVLKDGKQVNSTAASLDGDAMIKPLAPGVYTVRVSYTGFKGTEITGINVFDNKVSYVDVNLTPSVQQITEFVKIEFVEPLIDPDTKTGGNVTRAEYQQMATKNLNSVVSQTAGISQTDEGADVNVRGGRTDATETFIDGVRVVGSAGLPQSSIEQVSVITGGVPASFGDATSGIVNITTRGPQPKFFGGVEAITSELTDKFGYNFLGFSLGGPIYSKMGKDSVKNTIVGFIVSGEISTERDPDPSAVGMWKIKDDKLADLEKNPLQINPNGSNTLVQRSQFVTKDDMEKIAAKQNVRSNFARLNAKIDFKPSNNTNVTFGGSMDYNNKHDFIYDYALFNPSNNSQSIDNTWRVYGRLTQKFGTSNAEKSDDSKEKEKTTGLQNAFYTLQVNYTQVKNIEQDDNHKDNFFNYGYLGQFKTYKTPTFAFDNAKQAFVQDGIRDTLVTYTPNFDINPNGAYYAQSFFNIIDQYDQTVPNINEIQANGGIINGDRPVNVNGLWFNTGRQYGGYSLDDNSQLRLITNFSADVQNHAVQLGFEFEQRVERRFSISPIGLWSLMYQLANKAITDLDVNAPTTVTGGTYDTITYPRLYNAQEESQFSKSVREKFKIANDEWIDINNMKPEDFSLDMFSADDLLNNGNSYVNYYGYDYLGNKQSGRVTFNDFFTAKDEKGNFTRPVDAFRPIYMAGYIQDRFDFKDLKFNVGLRVDRFDANQQVLKDPFSLYATRKAGDVAEIGGKAVEHPSNIGSDYVVYVNNINDPTQIVGYRNGTRWYTAEGVELTNPAEIAQQTSTGVIYPYLINPKDGATDSTSTGIRSSSFKPEDSFEDYTAQINFMPRIAFSFPISKVANFFAHFDVLTQRPPSRLRMNPLDYYFMDINTGGVLNNPNLKPEKTIDYEVGFTQVLSEKTPSSLTLSAFYRELRNMIQITRFNYAYPVTYTSFGNIDFGTVTGFSVGYDLRRTKNVSLNANYTLSFANGTGSSDNQAQNIINNSNQPNLRTTIPLNFDQRHNFVANVDYRYGAGGSYNGPKIKDKNILENFGANLTFRAASGTPYSRQGNITQEAAIGLSQISVLSGSLNGSRLPFQFRFDLRVDKNFPVMLGKRGTEDEKKANLNVYVQVLNLLNAKNVISVYQATGNPNDDGYLTNPASQSVISASPSAQAFIDQYSVKINNPDNYSIPRRIRIGLTFDF